MTSVRGEFTERSAQPRTRAVPLAHLSLELGHLYMEDMTAGPDRLRAIFTDGAPGAESARSAVRAKLGREPRVSTCFLVDDYFSELIRPDQVIPQIMDAADAAGVSVDYLVREAGCARTR